MPIDKSWMQKSRVSSEYHKGVLEFLDFAFTNAPGKEMLPCPCIRCNNCVMQKREIMYDHLLDNGIARNYVRWLMHGEYEFCEPANTSTNESDMHDEMEEMLNDAFGMSMPNEESERSPHEALPEGETLPSNYYEAKKLLRDLGLHYIKIDACPSDCMLYSKEHANANECVVCGVSRWKSSDDNSTDEFTKSVKKKKIPAKVLRYFPLKPRLQRLYMSSKTASHMKWHVDGRMEGEMMRHPVDSLAWKNFDNVHPSFALEPRNVRLGLASDGFNPFGNMSISYSMWPVVLIPYNLPPWMCMKQTFFMLSLLIPGPTAPGNDIDIYLQPLIDELNDLWEVGVETYDASTKQNFCMRAAILWTINDFPAYANLSGWSTKGKFACPICNKDCSSYRLQNGRKWCYMGHRRFLPIDHRFRRDKKSFDGNEEHRAAPKHLSGEDVLHQLDGMEHITLGKTSKNKIIVGTLLSIDGKSKDNFNSRLDLQAMGIRDQLHPIQRGNRVMLPAACYSLTSNEKKEFCKFLKEVKVPDGYASNISRYLRTLKSYVCNKSHPEGSIVEGYMAEECTTFCSRYLHDVETKHDREERNYVIENNITNGGGLTIFKCMGRTIGKSTSRVLSTEEWSQAHLYVLTNCEEVTSFIEEHKQSIRVKPRIRARDVDLFHRREFISWFEERVSSFASARDKNPIPGHVSYYGVLTDVIELHYLGGNRVILFKCDWWDVINSGRGMKNDEYGFTCLNFERTICTDEPFVLASQAKQVFYVQNSNEENWHIVVEIQTRGVYDMNQKVSTNDPEPYQQLITLYSQRDVHELIENDLINWDRNDIVGETIQTDVLLSRQKNIVERDNEFIHDDDIDDEMSHRRGRVQIVSPEDELDNLQQLLDIQLAATTTPSSSDPSDSSDPSIVGSSSSKKRTRGLTRNLDLLSMKPRDKKTTRFNTRGQVVYGGKGERLSSYMGTLVRSQHNVPSKFKIGIMLVKIEAWSCSRHGFGPTPTSIFGSTSRRRSGVILSTQLETPKRCLIAAEQKFTTATEELSNVKDELSHVKETFEERLIEVQKKTREEVKEEFEEKVMEMQRKCKHKFKNR
ncbi:hypothetical protein CK203_055429 [Vitis vinifera]|uniref:Transposase-associated domain-containing protein n=1 Tax=Vitis vinifera TaxID=29760 RepID=A0A438GJI8_VITVI|nr:hypothetical protein CK203_055429 [Vitis vinifera]